MQRVRWAVIGLICTPLVAGCDSSAAPIDRPDGDLFLFDGAMIVIDAGSARVDGAAPSDTRGPADATLADGGIDPALDMRRFVPDIPLTYDGPLTDPGIELLAWTIREDPVLHDFDFLLAVRNTYGSPLCALTVDATFFTAGGAEVGTAGTLVDGPPHRGSSGSGRFVSSCISDGETGMMAAPLYLSAGRTVDEIASGTYVIGAINLTDAVTVADLPVLGVTTAPGAFRGSHFTGRVENRGRGTIRNPSVSIYGLNLVGRPLFQSRDLEILSVSLGASWAFSTSPDFEETYASYVAFPDADEP